MPPLRAPASAARTLVVVVTYNSARVIEQCLTSITKTSESDPCDVLLVDNASTDGTVDRARRSSLPLTVLRNGANVGFARAANQGLRRGLAEGYTVVALLNPDTTVRPGWLSACVTVLAQEKKVGIVQPVILLPGGAAIDTLGNSWHWLGFGECRDFGRPWSPTGTPVAPFESSAGGYRGVPVGRNPAPEAPSQRASTRLPGAGWPVPLSDRPIPCASGAAMVIRADLTRDIGLLEEDFFLYYEDTEYSIRAWKAGWKVQLAASAIVEHAHKGTIWPEKVYHWERNRLAMVFSLYDTRTLALCLPWLLVADLAVWSWVLWRGYGRMKLRSERGVLLGLWRRPTLRQLRRVPDRRLRRLMTAEVVLPAAPPSLTRLADVVSRAVWQFVVSPLL